MTGPNPSPKPDRSGRPAGRRSRTPTVGGDKGSDPSAAAPPAASRDARDPGGPNPRPNPGEAPGDHGLARTIVVRAVAIGVTGLAVYVVLPSLTRTVAAWPQLSHLSPIWLAGSLLAESISFACAFALQRLVLRTDKWFAVIGAGLTGNAVTKVLPGGAAAGAAVQFRMLATAGIDADNAAGGMTAATLLGIGGLLALPLFTLPAILGGAPVSPGLMHTALLGLLGFCLFVAGGALIMTSDRPLRMVGRIAERLWNRLPGRHSRVSGLDRRLLDERNEIRSTLGRDWLRAVVLTSGRLGFDYGCLLFALRATGSHPRPSLVLLAYAAAGILALVPLTPGGLGIVEASLSGLLILAGVPGGKAFVATLAYRLFSYWLPLVAGLPAYGLFRRRYPRAAAAPPTPPGPAA